ncbi:hypothetical protein P3W85_05850 [Cupriavidus basilensis]|uniref:Uncharacterized protein n=1 Tax=Cupriavidus basilensis TaxID=68895 RepID=A0ABT6AJ79_9BURK|nr:hypothetical protein [Cupriavidus basilensis]MDF3832468.1 hypothetical protein [Cupriavidus basilensis]
MNEARHPGKIALVTLTFIGVSGIHLRRPLSGPQCLRFTVGVAQRVRAAVPRPQMRIDDVIHIDPRAATLALQFNPTGLTRATK